MRLGTIAWTGVVSLAAGCGGGGGGGGGEPEKPSGDFVAFLADGVQPGLVELYVSDADGANLRLLNLPPSPTDGDVIEFAWSPDRSRIAYVQDKNGDFHPELHVVDPATGATVLLLDPGPNLAAAVLDFLWSPTSQHVAVRWTPAFGAATRLSVASADGTSTEVVSGTIVAAGNVVTGYRWSPDGSRIAFRGDLLVNDEFDLFTNDVEGLDRRQIDDFGFNPAAQVQEGFEWSPDGSRIAFVADMLAAGEMDLYTNDADGGDQVLESNPVPSADVTKFRWSPTANVLAYVHDGSNPTVFDLWSVTSPNGTPVNLTQYPQGTMDVDELAWAPDGSRIAVVDDQGHLLTVLPGGGSTPISADVLGTFVWSPDSSRIAFVRTDSAGGATFETLAVAPANGASTTDLTDYGIDGAGIFEVQWSPDGDRIAYVGLEDPAAGFDLVLSPPDEIDPLVLYDATPLEAVTLVGFSADSDTVCFTADLFTQTDIRTILVDGTEDVEVSASLQPAKDCFDAVLK